MSSRSGHSLTVSPSLTVICFRRPGGGGGGGSGGSRSGPLFVVREWDAKVIRVSKLSKAHKSKGMSTEQALRANVRQAILNMNLHLEPANKLEIQYLKSVGILGKRAPSCSLLYAKDLLRLLYAFDRKRVAEDLKNALGDESNFTLEDDPGRVIPRILIRSQHSQLNPVELQAYPKTPLQPEQYSIRQVEVSISKVTSVAIAKLLKANGGVAPRRLLVPDNTAAAAAAPAAPHARSGTSKSGSGSKRKSTSALDALLSVLGDAKHGDLAEDDEEMAQAHAAEHGHRPHHEHEEEQEDEDEGAADAERGGRSRDASAHYNGYARSYQDDHSKRRKRSHAHAHVVPALAAAVAAAASSSDDYSSPALGYGRRGESGSHHVPVSSPPSLAPASMDSPPPPSSGVEFAVPASRVRSHHHHGASSTSSNGGGGLPAALVMPGSPDRSLAPSPAASLFRSTLLSPLLPSSSAPSPSPSPSPPLPSTPSDLINSLRASLSVEEARKIASLFAAKASEAAASAQANSRPQSRASVSTAGGSGAGGGPASVSAVASAAAAAVADSLLLSVDTPRSFHMPASPAELLSPSIMRRLLSPSSASYTVHPSFPGVMPIPPAASSSASAAASSTPLGSPAMLRSSSQPSTAEGDGDSPEPTSLLSAAAAAASRLSSRRADRPQSLSIPPSPTPGSMQPPALPPLPMPSPTPAPFAMSDGGAMAAGGSATNEQAPVPFSMPLGAFAADADSAF